MNQRVAVIDELADATKNVPDSQRNLLACTRCKLILSGNQWRGSSCPNGCNDADDPTPDFSGMIAILMPQNSWVARYNRMVNLLPGLYAIHAEGYDTDGEEENPENEEEDDFIDMR